MDFLAIKRPPSKSRKLGRPVCPLCAVLLQCGGGTLLCACTCVLATTSAVYLVLFLSATYLRPVLIRALTLQEGVMLNIMYPSAKPISSVMKVPASPTEAKGSSVWTVTSVSYSAPSGQTDRSMSPLQRGTPACASSSPSGWKE